MESRIAKSAKKTFPPVNIFYDHFDAIYDSLSNQIVEH